MLLRITNWNIKRFFSITIFLTINSILGNLKVGDRNLYRITDIIIRIGAYKRDFDDCKEKIQEWTTELAYGDDLVIVWQYCDSGHYLAIHMKLL